MKADPNKAITEHVWSTGHKIQWAETTSNDRDGADPEGQKEGQGSIAHITSSSAMNFDSGLSLSPGWTTSWTAPSNNDRHFCGYDNLTQFFLISVLNYIQPYHALPHVHLSPFLFCCATHLA